MSTQGLSASATNQGFSSVQVLTALWCSATKSTSASMRVLTALWCSVTNQQGRSCGWGQDWGRGTPAESVCGRVWRTFKKEVSSDPLRRAAPPAAPQCTL